MESKNASITKRPTPRYLEIANLLSRAIERGSLEANTVLTEEPVARLFDTSRTPVRKAFAELFENGVLRQFEGRGYIVAGKNSSNEPQRITLTLSHLGLDEVDKISKQPRIISQRIAGDFEKSLLRALPFGVYQINEQMAADYYQVSRTVIRELLSRLNQRGLVTKDERSHWLIGPLTTRDVDNHYAIRSKLEPLALFESAQLISSQEIRAMWERAQAVYDQGSSRKKSECDVLEEDLHVHLLAKSKNSPLLTMISQSQSTLVINNLFFSTVGSTPPLSSIREHIIVLDFVMRKAFDMAAQALEQHIVLAAARSRNRLKTFSVFIEPELPQFLIRQKY
ncbi:GntR family transcriptional regulator [Sneathiella marina]|uniref:GntR family transcriptional regulator n=1 Tax=Sneathiella marina TaxID=2950108 RepID=A0ABY4W3W3_9PROT|nr:GntR family transcriptional regulator [Sneathiella marina]USG61599.1 GntR family transcriptional regulator [Sneathiella marina]